MANQPLLQELNIPDYSTEQWQKLPFRKRYEELFQIQRVPGGLQAKITKDAVRQLGIRNLDTDFILEETDITPGFTTYEEVYEQVFNGFNEPTAKKILDFSQGLAIRQPYFTNDWHTYVYEHASGDREALNPYERRNSGVKNALDTLLDRYPLPPEPDSLWEQDKVTHPYKVLLRQEGVMSGQYSFLSSDW